MQHRMLQFFIQQSLKLLLVGLNLLYFKVLFQCMPVIHISCIMDTCDINLPDVQLCPPPSVFRHTYQTNPLQLLQLLVQQLLVANFWTQAHNKHMHQKDIKEPQFYTIMLVSGTHNNTVTIYPIKTFCIFVDTYSYHSRSS